MDNSPRSTSPQSTSDRSYASVVNSPSVNETVDGKGSTSSLPSGKLTLKLKTKNGQNHHNGLRDQKLRHPAPRTTFNPAPKDGDKDDQNQVHDSKRPSSVTTFRMQRVQVPGLSSVHQPSTSQNGLTKDTQTVANHNSQIASMQATIAMLNDDVSRRTSELIEARTTIAFKDSSIDELKYVIESLEAEKSEYANFVDEENEENKQTILDLRRENEALRSAIHTGLISIAHVYGPDTSQAYTRVAEEAANRMANGQTPSERSKASSRELSQEPSREPSPEPSSAAPASVSSSSTLQPRILTDDVSHQQQPHSASNGQSLATSEEPKITENTTELLDETARLDVASEVHEDQGVKETPGTQESQFSQESCETREPQPVEDFDCQPTSVGDFSPGAKVKSIIVNIPTISPQTGNGSAKSKDEVHGSPASTLPPAHSTADTQAAGTPAADSPTVGSPVASLPTAQPPTIRPRSYATVASSPPKYKPIVPREKAEGKLVSLPLVRKSTPKTHKSDKSVSSGETGNVRWRERTIAEWAGARGQASSFNMTNRPAPLPSKANPSGPSTTAAAQAPSSGPQSTKNATSQSKGQPGEKEDGWESVKPKYKPRKKNKSKGMAQTQNQATHGANDKATPKEPSNVPMSTKPVPREDSAQSQPQQKWKRRNGTVIGSNSMFSQAANKQKEENQSGPIPQDSSHGRNVSNSGASSQRSSSGVQSKPSPKKAVDNSVNSMGPRESKFDWADEVEKEYSQKNPDDIVHSSF